MNRSSFEFAHSFGNRFSLPRSLSISVFCFLLATIVLAPALLAQTASTGALSGTITDPSGASVSGAQVKATNEATGEVRTALSNFNGNYILTLLPPGLYELEISKQGFKLAHASHLRVDVTETATFNVRMELGQ